MGDEIDELVLKEPFEKLVNGKLTLIACFGYADYNKPESGKTTKVKVDYACPCSLLMGSKRKACGLFCNSWSYLENHLFGKTHPHLPESVVEYYKLGGIPKEER